MSAKYKKIKKVIEASNLSQREIYSFLKIQIQCMIAFKSHDNINTEKFDDYIILHDRTYTGNKNTIVISSSEVSDKEISYDELINMISEKMKKYLLTIHIDTNVFNEMQPILTLVGLIKPAIIDSCVKLTFQDDTFGIINKPVNGYSNKLFYFDLNDSVLAFSEVGPTLIYDRFNSVEDVFCGK